MTLTVLILTVALIMSIMLFFTSRRRLAFKRCSPHAILFRTPVTQLKVFARDTDSLGLVARFGNTVDSISKGRVYVRHFDFNVHGAGADQFYTLDALLVGDLRQLTGLEKHINSGRLYECKDLDLQRTIARARPMLDISRAVQFKLVIEVTNTDEPLIVKTVAETALEFGGNATRFHGETLDPGRFPSTADFYINAAYGFPTLEAAERAYRALQKLPYDIMNVKRLYKTPSASEPLTLKIAA